VALLQHRARIDRGNSKYDLYRHFRARVDDLILEMEQQAVKLSSRARRKALAHAAVQTTASAGPPPGSPHEPARSARRDEPEINSSR
jgi:hypothetical protein